jgi:hypothetical protein
MNTLSNEALEFSRFAILVQMHEYEKKIAESKLDLENPEHNDIRKYYITKDLNTYQETLKGLQVANAEIHAMQWEKKSENK